MKKETLILSGKELRKITLEKDNEGAFNVLVESKIGDTKTVIDAGKITLDEKISEVKINTTDETLINANNIAYHYKRSKLYANLQGEFIKSKIKDVGDTYYAISEKINDDYEISKRNVLYQIVNGVFYKYMFKAIKYKQINIIFYISNCNKIKQFRNILDELNFRELFEKDIKQVISTSDKLEITFKNNSNIRFVYASDNARGYRYHYAIVDTNIDREVFCNIIEAKDILYDIDKEDRNLQDNYNIEYLEM